MWLNMPARRLISCDCGILTWLAVVIIVFWQFIGVVHAPDAPRPSFYKSLNDSAAPHTVHWLPTYENQPLTCGQKQNEDGTGFQLITMNAQEVVLQGSDMNGKDMRVMLHRDDFNRMFGGVWVTPLRPEQQEHR